MDISVFADSPTIDIFPTTTGADVRIRTKEITFTIYACDIASFIAAVREAVPGVLLQTGTDYNYTGDASVLFAYAKGWDYCHSGWIRCGDFGIKITGNVTMTTWN